MLQPGQQIRPQMSTKTATELVTRLYGMKVTSIKELNSYDDRNYSVQVAAKYENPYIEQLWPHGYVLKVLNSMDSLKQHVDAEHEAQFILMKNGYMCSHPVHNLHGSYKSLEPIYHDDRDNWIENNDAAVADRPHGNHIVRLMVFIPGLLFAEVPYTPQLLYKTGRYLAGIKMSLQGFSHPALTSHQTQWNLLSLPSLTEFLYAVKDENRVQLVKSVIQAFSEQVLPNMHNLQRGAIHGDFNEQNIIVRPVSGSEEKPVTGREHDIAGVIDFGDMNESCFVFDVAILIMYMMLESKIIDPMMAGGYVLAGYLQEEELNAFEMDVLKVCIAARYSTSLVMGAYTYMMDPSNTYLLLTAAKGWSQLQQLWAIPKEELYSRWRSVMHINNTAGKNSLSFERV